MPRSVRLCVARPRVAGPSRLLLLLLRAACVFPFLFFAPRRPIAYRVLNPTVEQSHPPPPRRPRVQRLHPNRLLVSIQGR